MTTARGCESGGPSARSTGTERTHATLTVHRCGVELRQAREEARRATEAARRARRVVEEAEDAFHQATLRLDRADGLRVTAR
jgi:hypothetical protein